MVAPIVWAIGLGITALASACSDPTKSEQEQKFDPITGSDSKAFLNGKEVPVLQVAPSALTKFANICPSLKGDYPERTLNDSWSTFSSFAVENKCYTYNNPPLFFPFQGKELQFLDDSTLSANIKAQTGALQVYTYSIGQPSQNLMRGIANFADLTSVKLIPFEVKPATLQSPVGAPTLFPSFPASPFINSEFAYKAEFVSTADVVWFNVDARPGSSQTSFINKITLVPKHVQGAPATTFTFPDQPIFPDINSSVDGIKYDDYKQFCHLDHSVSAATPDSLWVVHQPIFDSGLSEGLSNVVSQYTRATILQYDRATQTLQKKIELPYSRVEDFFWVPEAGKFYGTGGKNSIGQNQQQVLTPVIFSIDPQTGTVEEVIDTKLSARFYEFRLSRIYPDQYTLSYGKTPTFLFYRTKIGEPFSYVQATQNNNPNRIEISVERTYQTASGKMFLHKNTVGSEASFNPSLVGFNRDAYIADPKNQRVLQIQIPAESPEDQCLIEIKNPNNRTNCDLKTHPYPYAVTDPVSKSLSVFLNYGNNVYRASVQ